MPKETSNPSNVVTVDFSKKSAVKQPTLLSASERQQNEKKRSLFEKWLGFGTVSVLFDARAKDVKVPSEFCDRGDLRLNFSYDFLVADFRFDEEAAWATLSFDSGEYFCFVPWASVYGLQSEKLNQGAVWFDSFPADYDQAQVLGFNEDMCEEMSSKSLAEINDENLAPPKNNVVELNFSPVKDK